MARLLMLVVGLLTLVFPLLVSSFSATISTSGPVFFDRFRATCPADVSCIRQFDAALVDTSSTGTQAEDEVWVAVYRSTNNKPSVFIRDEFLASMKQATTTTETSVSVSPNKDPELFEPRPGVMLETPVAVGRLRPSEDVPGRKIMVLDSLRCLLRKEDQDDTCDGGSEFNEALSVGVDALLLHYLQAQTSAMASSEPSSKSNSNSNSFVAFAKFEGAIRTKTTLFSNRILEERGFEPVEELSKDMATHVSRYAACYDTYVERTVHQVSKHPGARDRALQIVALLGKLDPSQEVEEAAATVNNDDGSNHDDEIDPWAGLKQFL
jgi:hypothetical protein